MKRMLLLALPAMLALAANPLQPVGRGHYAPLAGADDFRVGFWDGTRFDPLVDHVPLPAELLSDGTGEEYWLVQFGGPVSENQVRALAGFIGFHSRFVAFVRADRDGIERVGELPFVRWTGPYHPGLKYWSGTLAGAGFGRVSVVLFRDADLGRAVADLAGLGLAPVRSAESESFKAVEVDCRQDQVAAIARLPYVLSVEEWHEPEPENVDCQWVAQTWAQGARRVWDQGVLGADEILGYTDTGLDANHHAFYDPSVPIADTGEFPTHRKVVVFKHYPPAGGVGDPNGHGTHVAGTIAGDDSLNGGASLHDGHARHARIVHLSPIPQPPGNDFTVPLNMITNDLRNPELRPRTLSHSWWTGDKGQYTTAAASFDNFAWFNRDIVLIKSCGNQYQTSQYQITEPGNSKSVISAASLQNGTNSTVLSTFSSRGPAPDGRIKPDLSIPGADINSARRNTQNSYTSMSGTSMAAPATNGAIGLCRSYLRKGYYPTGAENPADSFGYVSAALLKAMVLVSADPNIGSYTVPSEYVGWGRINLDSVLFFVDSAADARRLLVYDDTVGLATGEYVEYAFEISDEMPLRAGVVWTDTAAAAGANPALINDLDATLTAPGGDRFLGSRYSGGRSELNPAGDPDRLNPVEMFRVHDPEPGTWTLRVEGYNVSAGGRQPYGLVITGGVSTGERVDVGVTRILAPAGAVDSGTVVVPAAIVRNFGSAEARFPVHLTISMCYTDSAEVTLAAGASDTVRFSDWTAEPVGRHEVLCRSALAGDENPGNDQRTDTIEVIPGTGVAEGAALPTAFALEDARPTPFRGGTAVRYALPRAAEVEVAVYNAAGVRVRTLARGQAPAGRHTAHWNGRDDAGRELAPGVYLCRFEAEGRVRLRKLVKLD
ncbi:MAG: S8 family serine peptidase [bacterium]